MSDQARRGRPVNTFKKYPAINDAYAKARKLVLAIIEDFNDSHPEGLGYWAKDLPVMDYVQSCIPRHLNPPEFGRNTLKVQQRIRDILYTHLERGEFSPEQFAAWLGEAGRATRFTNQWMCERDPSPKRGKQPQIELASLMDAGFLVKGAIIYFSCEGKNYQGELTASGKFRCDMGNGVELYRSPHDAVRQTLSKVFNQWRACTTEDSGGNMVTLEEVRERFRRLKGL
jgi:hypothetical protein